MTAEYGEKILGLTFSEKEMKRIARGLLVAAKTAERQAMDDDSPVWTFRTVDWRELSTRFSEEETPVLTGHLHLTSDEIVFLLQTLAMREAGEPHGLTMVAQIKRKLRASLS